MDGASSLPFNQEIDEAKVKEEVHSYSLRQPCKNNGSTSYCLSFNFGLHSSENLDLRRLIPSPSSSFNPHMTSDFFSPLENNVVIDILDENMITHGDITISYIVGVRYLSNSLVLKELIL